jgi:transposase-like protein
MPRSTRIDGYVNSLSLEELKAVLGPHYATVIRQGCAGAFAALSRLIAEALIHGEVDDLCGPKHSRKSNGEAVRWGAQSGAITVQGVKEPISKPRVRSADGEHEIDLEMYAAFSKKDALRDEAIARIGGGTSVRQFAKTIRKELRHHGISKSATSRHVIESTKAILDQFLARRWDKHNFVAILIDGVHIGQAHVIAAVGVDRSGYKHILGWKVGTTESAVACRDLLRRLAESGLDLDKPYLFVLDGSKALRLAVQERFGANAQIQRCQEHKIRDVEGYLPVRVRKRFRLLMQAAYNEKTYTAASERLQKIRLQLLTQSEPAANSLTEGLEQTLTLHKLGINGGVRHSLRSTNIIESAFSGLRRRTKDISAWSDSAQIERWLAFGLTKTEASFRRLPGFRQLNKLQRKLHSALQTANN